MPKIQVLCTLPLLAILVGCHSPSKQVASSSEEVSPPEVRDDVPEDPEPVGPAVALLEESFPFEELHSYFLSGQDAIAMKLYRRQEYSQAKEAIDLAISANKDPEHRQHLQILLAVIERDDNQFLEAATRFALAADSDPILSDYLNSQAAQAYARAGDANAGVRAALVSPQSPWASELEFLLASAARDSKQYDAAIEHYRKYIEATGRGELVDQARYHLGVVLQTTAQVDAGRAVWRKLTISSPVSPWTMRVKEQQKGKKSQRRAVDTNLSGTERIERGMGYFVAMRNLASEADFAAAIRRSDLTKEERCQALFHRAKSVYKERKYSRSAPLFEPAIAACKASGNTNYEVKSAYQAGLAFSRGGDHERAVKHYAYIESYPEHSYADDARLRQAEELHTLKRDSEVTKLLSTLPGLYPEGDMRGEALWRLARRAYQRKKYESAVSWLTKQIAAVPIEEKWWAEGQAQYWLGRSLAHLGRMPEAAKAYADCISLYPLTYYSMQAFNRLREGWPEQYQTSLHAVKNQTAPWNYKMRNRKVYATKAFRAGLRLARLGLGKPAKRQLAAIGMEVPTGRKAERDPERIDWLVATEMLLDLAGDYEGSHWIGRWHAIDYRRSWPTGDNALRWRLAYPLAYWELLQEFAKSYTYPAHLQMAIVREESAFDPARESYANAIGLTQMIFPTAHDHSVGSGIAVTRENLQHPVKNVTIGSHFLESLQQAFEGRVGLMVPGYNAGRARVRGWIRRRHAYDLDEFIERIGGDQARRYTKRVLGSFFTYRYLSDGTIPVVRNEVPFRLSKLPSRRRNK